MYKVIHTKVPAPAHPVHVVERNGKLETKLAGDNSGVVQIKLLFLFLDGG